MIYDVAGAFSKGLKNSNCNIISLNLRSNNIGDDSIKEIVSFLDSEKSAGLRNLNLRNNSIRINGATSIARVLESGKLNNLNC